MFKDPIIKHIIAAKSSGDANNSGTPCALIESTTEVKFVIFFGIALIKITEKQSLPIKSMYFFPNEYSIGFINLLSIYPNE